MEDIDNEQISVKKTVNKMESKEPLDEKVPKKGTSEENVDCVCVSGATEDSAKEIHGIGCEKS